MSSTSEWVSPAIEFVGDQKLGFRCHGAGEFELAHLHLGQLARQPPRLVFETDLAQHLEASRLDVRRGAAAAARRDGVEEGNAHVVEEAEARERPRQLKGTGKAAVRALVRGRAVEPVAVEAHRTGLVAQRAADAVDQRALAGAVRSDQADAFAGGY